MRIIRQESIERVGDELTKRLLLESEENGVNELDIFEVVVDHVVEFEALKHGQTILHVKALWIRTDDHCSVAQIDQKNPWFHKPGITSSAIRATNNALPR